MDKQEKPTQLMQATYPANLVDVGMNTDLNDSASMLDADPFNLDKSMRFPTQFTF